MSLSFQERMAVQWRMLENATDELFFGPAAAIGLGTTAVFLIGVVEASAYCKNNVAQSWYFCARYSVAQIIPSLIWGTQPPALIAALTETPLHQLYAPHELSHRRALRVTRFQALRGAIAGSVLLSQVLGLVNIGYTAKMSYEKRCAEGREPPLKCVSTSNNNNNNTNTDGVVVRMAGRESNVTDFTMALLGRRAVFPIFEDSQRPNVRELVREYSRKVKPSVPIYWQVDSGRYSQNDSWHRLRIPREWICTTAQGEQLLVLEADATTGQQSSLSLKRTFDAKDLDLDLFEVAQGFHRLPTLLEGGRPDDLKVLRVLLCDAETKIVSGGGREATVRGYVTELNLADILIDCRSPLVHSVLEWLGQAVPEAVAAKASKTKLLSSVKGGIPVILETPHQEWFASIKSELALYGYQIIDRCEAGPRFGLATTDLPVLVYENSSADTIHTVRQIVSAGIAAPTKVCALITDYEGTKLAASGLPEGAESICSSEIYFRLFTWVRESALKGDKWQDIQRDLDKGIALEK